ncbi:MAG: flippase [Patescibacteria group bacterium]
MVNRLKSLLFQNRGTRQTIVKNVFWLSISQVGSRLIRAVIIIYAARVLGAAEYGIFSYVLGLAGFFTIFADMGVNAILTKDAAGHPERRGESFSTSFWIKMFLFLITALLVVLVAPHFSKIEQAAVLIPLVAFLIVFDGIKDFFVAFLRGLEKMEWESFIVTAMNIMIMVAGFIILSFSHTAKALIISYIASVGFSAILGIIVLKKWFAKIFYFSKVLARQIINTAWPLAFSAALGAFMLNTDIIMLGWWRTAEEIGYYSAAQRIIGILYTLPAIFASAVFPALSRFTRQNEQRKTKELNEKSMTIIFLIAIPLIVGGFILSQPIINLIFGQEYLPAASALNILITTLIFAFPGALLFNFVIAYDQQKKMVYYVAVGALGNIILNILLIPIYGIIGSAIATFIAQFLYYGLTWLRIKKITNIQIFPYLKKIIVSAIIMGIFCFIFDKLKLNAVVNIIVSAGIYLGTLYLMKEEILKEIISLFKNRSIIN